jgi:hypothetical protein
MRVSRSRSLQRTPSSSDWRSLLERHPQRDQRLLDGRAALAGGELVAQETLHPHRRQLRQLDAAEAWDEVDTDGGDLRAVGARPDDVRGQGCESHVAAVDAAIGYLTAHACVARPGRDGVDRQDGSQLGFVRGEFTHVCSREGDPRLHSDTILVNILEAPDGRRAASTAGCWSSTRKPPTASTMPRYALD